MFAAWLREATKVYTFFNFGGAALKEYFRHFTRPKKFLNWCSHLIFPYDMMINVFSCQWLIKILLAHICMKGWGRGCFNVVYYIIYSMHYTCNWVFTQHCRLGDDRFTVERSRRSMISPIMGNILQSKYLDYLCWWKLAEVRQEGDYYINPIFVDCKTWLSKVM